MSLCWNHALRDCQVCTGLEKRGIIAGVHWAREDTTPRIQVACSDKDYLVKPMYDWADEERIYTADPEDPELPKGKLFYSFDQDKITCPECLVQVAYRLAVEDKGKADEIFDMLKEKGHTLYWARGGGAIFGPHTQVVMRRLLASMGCKLKSEMVGEYIDSDKTIIEVTKYERS